jgi:opacity protein-like surface antigen
MYAIRTIIIASLLLLTLPAKAQDCFYERNVHEIGALVGATYYMGDFNPNRTPLVYPSFYVGGMYRYNFSTRFALRGQFGYGYVRGSGADVAGIPADPIGNDWRFNRPYFFLDAMVEFNFLPYYAANIYRKQRFTPVLLIGAGGFLLFENSGSDYKQHELRDASKIVFEMPVGVGVKWCFTKRATLGVEWLWKLTLYDIVDYYSPINVNHSNPVHNDWIGTVGITLSYLIHEQRPCPAIKAYQPSKWHYKGYNYEHQKPKKNKKVKKKLSK